MLEEVLQAIKVRPNNTALGANGFPNSFYKAFVTLLAPYLTEIYDYVTPSMMDSLLTLIIKQGKEAKPPKMCHPVALLKSDMKIFIKILTA